MTDNIKWQELAEKYKKMIAGDDTQQVVYKSDTDDNCKPVIVSKISANSYPYVVEEPVGMLDPKYVWLPDNPHWVDLAIEKQADEIATLTARVDSLASEHTDLLKLISLAATKGNSNKAGSEN